MIKIDAAYSYRTYGGMYAGAPSPAQLIAKAKREAKDLWGERATLTIDPAIHDKHLPEWVHMVWFSGPAMSEVADGSELVVIYWSAYAPASFDHVLNAIDWQRHAQDYNI